MATNEQNDPFEQSRRAMAAALSGNSDTNPDAEARDQREARRMGVTPQAVRDARATGTPLPPHLRNLSLDEIPQRAPGTARYLSNPNNARVAHDDIDGLTAAELALRAQGNFAGQQLTAPPRRAPTFGNILRGLGSAFVDAVGPDGSVVRGTQLMLGDQLSRTPLGNMRDATGNLIFTQADREAGETRFLEAQANLERNRPELDGAAGAIYGGAESFVRTSGALAASVATRSPAPLLVAAGTQTSGEAYGRYSARGATANEALLGASGEAAVEVVTELIPIKKLLDVFGADSLKKGIIDAAKGQFADQVGEQIATLAQDAIDTAIANPDKTWNEYWAERPDAAFQTAVATAVQGVLQTGTVGGASLVNAAFQQRQQRQEQQAHADAQAQFAENMQKVAEASALRARSPESFEEFVREATADGPVDTIYVDAQVFNQAAQDAGVDLEALVAAVPDLGAQLQNALETEGDLQIPVAGFAAHIAGTDLGAALIDHARVDPNAPSRAEIAAAGENASAEIRAEVERMLGETAGRDDIAQSAENVRQDIKAQLDRAGRFTPQVNEAYASWVSAYYATRSAQLGITPEEMAAKYRLNIAAISSPTEGTTLEQQVEAPAKKGFIEKLVDGLRGSPRAQETTDVVETAKEMVRLVHFSRRTGLTETDPAMWGASPATPAEERARTETAPGRTYFYDSTITERPEYGVGQRSPFTYTAEVERAALYDMDADPDNLREGRDASAFENAIRDAGYKGFFSNEVVNGAVAVFDPIGLNQIGPVRAWQQFHALNALMDRKANAKRRELVAAQDPNSQEIIATPPREDFRDEAMRELFGVGAALDEQRARYEMIAGAPKSVRVNGERLNLRPTPSARDAAYAYMETNGLQYEPPREYAKVDVARAKRIASAFDQMQHAPDDPLVRASYRAMIEETLAQYQFVKASGLEVSLIEEGMADPYAASPRLATEDVRKNNHLWVFPTDFGFGGPNASDIDISGNPLLEWTDEYIGDKRLRANDVFRIVHDYFGHVKDGFGFRADGEENAWQSHAAMFTPLARRAMTTETRGQNSWVNFGPYGEKNRTASASNTEYAPQKIGILPEWVSEDGFLGGPNSGVPVGQDAAMYDQSDAPTNPPFFSSLKRAVADSKTAKAPAAQWRATLAKTAGVKAEELEWTGLNEWLDMQEGSIERGAILSFLDAGGIQLEETVLGSTSSLSDLSEFMSPSVVRALRGASTREEAIMQLENDGDAYRALQATHPELFEAEDGEFNEDWAEQVVDEVYVEDGAAREELDGNAEYSSYKLPGADDTYREFLIRLPQIRGERFQSAEGHFDNYDDIIGHARFTTRTDAEGRKILFLEEVQSTHHETGREQGYKGNVPQEEIDRLREASEDAYVAADRWHVDNRSAIEAETESAISRLAELADTTEDTRFAHSLRGEVDYMTSRLERLREATVPGQVLREVFNITSRAVTRTLNDRERESLMLLVEEQQRVALAKREAEIAYQSALEGVEPAPWTKSWSQLVMKRMTRYAVDNGFDGVAWINGNQQNGGQTGGDGSWFYERNLVNETNAILKKLGSRVEKIDLTGPDLRNEAEQRVRERPSTDLGTQNGFLLTDKIKEQAAQGFALFQPKRGHITFGRDITMSPSTVTLLRTADLSTFLHETGHFFLEVDAHIASQPSAPQQIKDDFQSLLNWFGVKDIETWNALPIEEKRPHHERFARGMEMYLLEGRAPTLQMGEMFRRFSAWLKAVYKQLSQLNVTLTDEVRGVMDRMTASEEAIAEAEAAYSLRPFSQDRPAFMDEQQWAEYQAQFADATAEGVHEVESRAARDMKWLSNAKSKALKRLQREANTQRRQVKAEVTEEVRDEPVYRALRFLTHGIDQDGNPIEGAGKLDLDTLISVYGDTVEGQEPPVWTKLRRGGRYGLVGVDGVHPDVVAETFGFASGDALIRALADAEDINQRIVGLTDARMLERYGDLADERALEEAANLAVANDARMRVLNTEYAALAKATGQPRALAAAAREHAARIVNDMPVRRLKPHHFFTAAARAGRNAEKAIRKGDLVQAAVHKRNQIVNLQAARKVIEAKDEVNKALKLFTRITSAKDENIAKTRDMPLVNAARGILAQYGLSRAKNDPVAEIEKLKRYDPDLYADMAVFLALGPSAAKDFQNISFEEFTALRDNVGSLWVMSRQSKQIVLDGQAREIAEVANEMRERLDAIGIPEDRPGTSRAPTPQERFARKLQGARASLRRVEHWVRAIDSGERGIFRKAIWQPVSEAADSYRTDSARFLRLFLDIVQPIEEDLAKKARIAAPEIGYTFNDKAELLHAILHTGNGSNLSKLLLGRQWGGKTADGGLDTSKWDAFVDRMHREGVIRKEHYDFAQAVWDLLEETKPLAQRAHRRMYGRYFAEVTADPFDTPWGEYRGGYVPATTDSFLVSDAALRADELAIQENSAAMFPAASNGFTKSRVEDYTRALALDVRLLPMHIDKVLRFAHLGPPVKEVARLIKQRRLAEAMEAQDPVVVSNLLLPWLQRSANQTVSTPMQGEGGKLVDTFFKELRSRTGMQLMFANVSNVLQQVSGIPSAALRVKKGHLARATWQYLRAPTETANAVAGLSEFMATRMSSQIFETRQAIEDMLLNPSKYDKLRKFSERHGYFAQMFAQNITDVVVWTGAYNQQIENGREEKEAIRIANSVIRDTQNSMSPEDISRFETGTSFVRAFTQFYSHFNNQANLLGTEYLNVLRTTGAKKGAGRLLYLYVVGYAAQAAVADAIAELFRGGWEDEDDDGYLDDLLAWFAGSQVRYGAAMVPVIGPGVNAAMAMADKNPANDRVSVSPAVSMYEGAVRVPVEVYKTIVEGDDFNRRDVRDTFTLLGMLTGTPLGFFGRPAGYLKDIADGKVEPTGPVDFARGLITGTPSPDSKQ